ncbi:MAG: DUF6261 family protein [Prevotellaceae bacterium]|jgi:hypothetical protein|nr:DUF6261 family protein [Prevotellaceae bacterium]
MAKFIQRIEVTHLRTKTHFELMTEIGKVLSGSAGKALKIDGQVTLFFELLTDEDTAILQVRKYETTDKIGNLNTKRDNLLRGINNLLKAALIHFDPQVCDAAKKLMIVFRAYGKIVDLPYDDETAAIYNLLQETDRRSVEAEAAGIAAWLAELRQTNEELRNLMAVRYSEESKRTHLKLRDVRRQIDAVYHDIVYRLEAGATLDGAEQYNEIFAEINARISRYANILAQEQGRRNKKKENIENNEN